MQISSTACTAQKTNSRVGTRLGHGITPRRLNKKYSVVSMTLNVLFFFKKKTALAVLEISGGFENNQSCEEDFDHVDNPNGFIYTRFYLHETSTQRAW